MKVKTILPLVCLAASAFSQEMKILETSNKETKLLTKEGHEIPEEFLEYFKYNFEQDASSNVQYISATKRKCHHKY